MKKSLLVAILLLPLAFAKATPGSQIVPLPDCFPCEPDPIIIARAAGIVPLPDCCPCEPDPIIIVRIGRIVPLPDCFPCEPDPIIIVRAATKKLIATVRGLRREA